MSKGTKPKTARNRRIAELVIDHGEKHTDIAEKFGITASRVRQIAIRHGYKNRRRYCFSTTNPNGYERRDE